MMLVNVTIVADRTPNRRMLPVARRTLRLGLPTGADHCIGDRVRPGESPKLRSTQPTGRVRDVSPALLMTQT